MFVKAIDFFAAQEFVENGGHLTPGQWIVDTFGNKGRVLSTNGVLSVCFRPDQFKRVYADYYKPRSNLFDVTFYGEHEHENMRIAESEFDEALEYFEESCGPAYMIKRKRVTYA